MLWNSKWFPGTNLQDLNLDWILKKVSALRGGNTGQYLYKKSDKDFDFGWKTGGGGGGGTSDYLDLDNKPSINNVELAGNKTAADLGLASASDIPEVPVQSVNGKTGAVVLSASDVGAYVKPATGIPKTDLSGAVQTSLDKADSALQAVPPAYRTATAQDTIDAAQDAKIETIAGNLAMIESSPATTAHVVGEYIVYNGQLYKVTTAIAAGQTLTVGTNISAVSSGGMNDLINQSSFLPGEIFELYYTPLVGFITETASKVMLTIITPKSMERISTLNLLSFSGGIRGISGYIDDNYDNTNLIDKGYSFALSKRSNNIINIDVRKSTALTNATNNTPAIISCNPIRIQFT